MKKEVIIWILIALIIGGIVGYFIPRPSIEPLLEDSQQECKRVGGVWREFNNGCVDSCSLERRPKEIACTQAFTNGCDCGEDKCWNGETCEKN
tara:strand:+ start:1795 stop:2073 length:279 start_codon:yes stop_codon:yes gene_type:complete